MKNIMNLHVSTILMVMVMSLTPVNTYASIHINQIREESVRMETKIVNQSMDQLTATEVHKESQLKEQEKLLIEESREAVIEEATEVSEETMEQASAVLNQTIERASTVPEAAIEKSTESSVMLQEEVPAQIVGALDWFKEVRELWPRGVDAKVTDIKTGKSFTVKRTYGTNHADVEPLTKDDTRIIKQIWGGFSWERRAVVVEFENYTIAASMSAMPHAGVDNKPANAILNQRSGGYKRGYNLDAVKNNGADGVMDLHFKNSKTHGTNRIQKSMQDMVKKAERFILK